MRAEIAERVDFSRVRYGQCWEDADVLLEGLDIGPDHVCLSIASAGDNVLAMLSRGPKRVVALDLSRAQLACLELRVAAYRVLTHGELLELMGSRPSERRHALYGRCRNRLSPEALAFWDNHPEAIAGGIAGAGKFERFLSLFRRWILPLVHRRSLIQELMQHRSQSERESFYDRQWNGMLWRCLFRTFFSRFMLGRGARDPRFFDHAEHDIAKHLLRRARHAATFLDPSANPYLYWILNGRHGAALPYALREENFDAIRANLDRLELRCQSLEAFLDEAGEASIDRFNLSDIFEYMSHEHFALVLARISRSALTGGRLAYWNLVAERRRPLSMSRELRPLQELSDTLHRKDKAFFYRAFVVEEKC
jgi:S-adenosylmethionine-diacylglycerol 3-amino-3-carboxypropyl transferase